ncbi:hypothetical protein R3P38DRAFT_2786465 [Favolaschia claudopus]|uniref:Uncharacterized protein n=1 Tax=Favolaschia claudopus TaxID=2862362 RepID=A0AAW0ARU1_9AGAR
MLLYMVPSNNVPAYDDYNHHYGLPTFPTPSAPWDDASSAPLPPPQGSEPAFLPNYGVPTQPNPSAAVNNVASAPSPEPEAEAEALGSRKRAGSDSVVPDAPVKRGRGQNIPPAAIDVLDSEDEMNAAADGKTRHWAPDERSEAYQFILGIDENERLCGATQPLHRHVEPGRSDKPRPLSLVQGRNNFEVSELVFNGERTPSSVKSMFARSVETFGWIRIRYQKVARKTARNSASALSDCEEDASDDDSDRKDRKDSKPAAQVPNTPASTVGASLGNIGDFMKVKLEAEEKKADVLEAKLKLEREKFENDKIRGKVDMANHVLNSTGASEQVKDAANAFLLQLFST